MNKSKNDNGSTFKEKFSSLLSNRLYDTLNLVFLAVGFMLSIISLKTGILKNGLWAIYFALLAVQTLIVLMIIIIFVVKARYENNIKSLSDENRKMRDQLSVYADEIEKKENAKAEYQHYLIEQNGFIASAIKNNSQHNNEKMIRLSAENEEVFSHIEEISTTYEYEYKEADTDEKKEEAKNKAKLHLKNASEKYASDLFEIYKRYCSDMIAEIEKLESAYLRIKGHNDRISIAIKLFVKPVVKNQFNTHEKNIYTAFRDKESFNDRDESGRQKREIGRNKYSVEENSDFDHCLSSEYYKINQAKKGNGNYKNEHTDFDRYYNCTIVVPIRVKQSDNNFLFMGYLCCDCKNDKGEEVFDIQSAQYLFMFAQNMATFLQIMDSNWKDRFQDYDNVASSILEVIHEQTMKTVI